MNLEEKKKESKLWTRTRVDWSEVSSLPLAEPVHILEINKGEKEDNHNSFILSLSLALKSQKSKNLARTPNEDIKSSCYAFVPSQSRY